MVRVCLASLPGQNHQNHITTITSFTFQKKIGSTDSHRVVIPIDSIEALSKVSERQKKKKKKIKVSSRLTFHSPFVFTGATVPVRAGHRQRAEISAEERLGIVLHSHLHLPKNKLLLTPECFKYNQSYAFANFVNRDGVIANIVQQASKWGHTLKSSSQSDRLPPPSAGASSRAIDGTSKREKMDAKGKGREQENEKENEKETANERRREESRNRKRRSISLSSKRGTGGAAATRGMGLWGRYLCWGWEAR